MLTYHIIVTVNARSRRRACLYVIRAMVYSLFTNAPIDYTRNPI
jgi:hypothetical protein